MNNNIDAKLLKALYEHRLGLNEGDTSEKETPQFWDEKAEKFANQAHSGSGRNEVMEFLSRFDWQKDESVLDVAAGPGTFSLPLAKMVKEVVAADFSEKMLFELEKRAHAEHLENIKTIHGRWLDLLIQEKFDTVLCLNSLGVIAADAGHNSRIDAALVKLRDCCRKRLIILIPHADSPLPSGLRAALGIEDIPLERRRIAAIFAAMVECGMLPEFQLIYRPFHWKFKDGIEARQIIMQKAGLKEIKKQNDFEEFIQSRLFKADDGSFCFNGQLAQGLFVWQRL